MEFSFQRLAAFVVSPRRHSAGTTQSANASQDVRVSPRAFFLGIL
jgi:hypothetical protein